MSGDDTGFRARLLEGLVERTVPLYRRLTRGRTAPWGLTREELAARPPGTLGHAMGRFLIRYDLQPMSALESHDAFHVLLGYQQTVLDEARMQCCLVGSGRRSLYSLGTVLLALAVYPGHAADFARHLRRGQRLLDFSRWDFLALLDTGLEELQQRIGCR